MMKLFDVYPLYDIEIQRGEGSYVWDAHGNRYLDLYGGHAVISIGHTHPHFVEKITSQLKRIAFYSNSVQIPLQHELADKLGALSGKNDYQLFLCNSGAEANENALKLASFHNGKKHIIAFKNSFHGRTSLAVAVTDNPSIQAPVNEYPQVSFLPLNDLDALDACFAQHEICAVIIEGIQGVGGINVAEPVFLRKIRALCDRDNAVFIADSVQCGYGRTGTFFSHDLSGVNADIYSMAKGMGNGFPIGGILISPAIKARFGLLGTTFGGNHLACAAGIAVLDVIKEENLLENAAGVGQYLMEELGRLDGISSVRGRGLMIGIELEGDATALRKELLNTHHIFTGAAGSHIIRLLPSLALAKEQASRFLEVFSEMLAARKPA